MTNFQIVAMCAVLSLLPVIAWGSLFLYKHGEKRELVIKTFVFSAIAVIPLVFYRLIMGVIPQNQINEYLQTIINFQLFESILPFNLLILFLTIGFVEEYLKHFVAAKVDQDEIDNIDDAIEFSIIAALGFSFAENTFYFIDVYQNLELAIFWKVVIFRSMFSTLAHIIFSSIYGYHYGLALFGKNIAHRRDFTFVKSINRVWKSKKFKKEVLGNIPLGKFAELSDVSSAAVFLASDAAAMITGTSLLVDGGWTAR